MVSNSVLAFTGVPATRSGHLRMSASNSTTTSRRTALRLLAAVALGVSPAITSHTASVLAATQKDGEPSAEDFEALTKRRYLINGRPPPENPPPKFSRDRPVFDLADGLRAQDVKAGTGEAASSESLVVARWRVLLDDGTLLDDSNLKQPALFRPGAHQVPPGIEEAVVGMQPGGTRLVSGSAERILTDVALGYDIGERSVVPNNSQLYIEIAVDRLNPFGKR